LIKSFLLFQSCLLAMFISFKLIKYTFIGFTFKKVMLRLSIIFILFSALTTSSIIFFRSNIETFIYWLLKSDNSIYFFSALLYIAVFIFLYEILQKGVIKIYYHIKSRKNK